MWFPGRWKQNDNSTDTCPHPAPRSMFNAHFAPKCWSFISHEQILPHSGVRASPLSRCISIELGDALHVTSQRCRCFQRPGPSLLIISRFVFLFCGNHTVLLWCSDDGDDAIIIVRGCLCCAMSRQGLARRKFEFTVHVVVARRLESTLQRSLLSMLSYHIDVSYMLLCHTCVVVTYIHFILCVYMSTIVESPDATHSYVQSMGSRNASCKSLLVSQRTKPRASCSPKI